MEKGRKRKKARIDSVLKLKYFFISPKKNKKALDERMALVFHILLEKFLSLIHLIDG